MTVAYSLLALAYHVLFSASYSILPIASIKRQRGGVTSVTVYHASHQWRNGSCRSLRGRLMLHPPLVPVLATMPASLERPLALACPVPALFLRVWLAIPCTQVEGIQGESGYRDDSH